MIRLQATNLETKGSGRNQPERMIRLWWMLFGTSIAPTEAGEKKKYVHDGEVLW